MELKYYAGKDVFDAIMDCLERICDYPSHHERECSRTDVLHDGEENAA